TKHSGFIINKGNASFSQLMELIQIVKDTVKEKTGYVLECEPLIITDKKL
ncbi:MAG: UDP-N-acetylmuramate dehydrogenase, partial [Oscillospiraceae bacterium]|nr:UDP-N-acetylmuramate dehydrogenase [Oscillospiraceae bacterium]